jgi:hypothetical protein
MDGRTFNLFEAALWFLISMALLFAAYRACGARRRLYLLLSVAFLVFAVSDVIEADTGAWWRPFWLLLLKIGCLVVFVYGIWEYQRIGRAKGT